MNLKQMQNKLNESTTIEELTVIAGFLNNRPEHIKSDKCTCLGFLSFEGGKNHVQYMLNVSLRVVK